ncbi:retropepsin-like aspartic protease family protein [Ferrimonas lipolytica]|uniref:TIGR02281 family clan AA aspartic protease n=1 Tax=Ferrimonas lipolytica TaxID=2724191 RepID=A0A6H1UL76_9GAMM|nr:retropepsin-like aspartic protease [Ferrimonas lipolytica]QIZ78552.1 TIGR02281 family clan AA aspartic protease [Ferrimonas lipolytica]
MPSTATSQTRTGKLMFVMAWLILAALLYFYFDQKIERQYNPNQNVSTDAANTITLQQNRQGHYVTSALLNEQAVVMLLDTGATEISIPAAVADKLQLPRGRPFQVNTANGSIRVWQTHIESLSIGGLTLYNLSAHINPGLDGHTILLGMNALRDLELVQRGKRLTLRKY